MKNACCLAIGLALAAHALAAEPTAHASPAQAAAAAAQFPRAPQFLVKDLKLARAYELERIAFTRENGDAFKRCLDAATSVKAFEGCQAEFYLAQGRKQAQLATSGRFEAAYAVPKDAAASATFVPGKTTVTAPD